MRDFSLYHKPFLHLSIIKHYDSACYHKSNVYDLVPVLI